MNWLWDQLGFMMGDIANMDMMMAEVCYWNE
jgi:hypothetical protein